MTPAGDSPPIASLETIARPESLGAVLAFIDAACDRAGITGSTRHDLRLAVEEVCTNVIQHGYRDTAPGPLLLEFREREGQLVVVVEDRARPFDPASAPGVELDAGWEDRERGGLGWYLVRNVVDEIRYERPHGRGNRVTLMKRRQPGGTKR